MPGATSAPPAAPMRAPRIPPNPAKIQVTFKVSSSNSLSQNILFLDIFLAENSFIFRVIGNGDTSGQVLTCSSKTTPSESSNYGSNKDQTHDGAKLK